MTFEEGIERLKCMKLFMQINDKDSESKFLEEDYEANSMAISALEKQIPKKWLIDEPDWDDDNPNYKCLCCKEVWFLMQGTPKDNEYNYCPKCGQRLVL